MTGSDPKLGRPLEPGLYLVATPIGSARDITLRALDVLAQADVIAAEDTRTARKLMDIHGIALAGRPLLAYHDHSGDKARATLAARIAEDAAVAYVSEAGSPLIADPGFDLVRKVTGDGHMVTAVPGPSAMVAALSVAGLPTDRFFFEGFLPVKPGARQKRLAELRELEATLVFYEAPGRVERTMRDMATVFGESRVMALCRELTKRFEQVMRGTIGEIKDSLGSDVPLKGEFVLVVSAGEAAAVSDEDIDARLAEALETLSLRDAAGFVAETLGLPRKSVYARALALKEGKG